MFSYRQRDIVLVPFPFTDATTVKQRPVLVVSTDEINSSRDSDFIGLAITSKFHGGKYSFVITGKECEEGKLLVNSEVQCNKIATIQKNLVLKKLCKIKKDAYQKVVDKLKLSLHIQ